jgi:hypothetical protein
VKVEDVDWLVYHLIPQGSPATTETLVNKSGLETSVVEDSLARLERFCLVKRSGNTVQMLSFSEALVTNQIKYDKDLPFVIENGVIREKKRSG